MVPVDNGREAAVVNGIDVYPVDTMAQVVSFLRGDLRLESAKVDVSTIFDNSSKFGCGFFRGHGPGACQAGP